MKEYIRRSRMLNILVMRSQTKHMNSLTNHLLLHSTGKIFMNLLHILMMLLIQLTESADRICLYKPKKLIPIYTEMADLIFEGAKEIETAIHCLKDPVANKEKITSACERVTAIEHEADELYFARVSELFEKEEDPKELLKNNKILEILERCVDEEEDVTDTLKAILIKMA